MTVGGREMEGEEDCGRGKLNRNCVGQNDKENSRYLCEIKWKYQRQKIRTDEF